MEEPPPLSPPPSRAAPPAFPVSEEVGLSNVVSLDVVGSSGGSRHGGATVVGRSAAASISSWGSYDAQALGRHGPVGCALATDSTPHAVGVGVDGLLAGSSAPAPDCCPTATMVGSGDVRARITVGYSRLGGSCAGGRRCSSAVGSDDDPGDGDGSSEVDLEAVVRPPPRLTVAGFVAVAGGGSRGSKVGSLRSGNSATGADGIPNVRQLFGDLPSPAVDADVAVSRFWKEVVVDDGAGDFPPLKFSTRNNALNVARHDGFSNGSLRVIQFDAMQ